MDAAKQVPWLWIAVAVLTFIAGGFCDFALQTAISLSESRKKLEAVKAEVATPKVFEVTKAQIAEAHRKGMMFLDSEGNVLLIKKGEP